VPRHLIIRECELCRWASIGSKQVATERICHLTGNRWCNFHAESRHYLSPPRL
jgi:hypothetical protein